MVGTRAATFPGCAAITHCLPHTPVQIIFFVFFLYIKKFGAHFPLRVFNWSFGNDFPYNSNVITYFGLLGNDKMCVP